MSNSALITGGAGFLGVNLVRFLLKIGWEVTVLDITPFDYPERERVRSLVGDVRNIEDVREAALGSNALVHAAAALPLYPRNEVMTTDVCGTRVCLQVAMDYGMERFVHISSTAVYGIPDHPPVLESDPLVGVGPYGEAKVKAEELCIQFRKQGLCVPVIRPKSFVGKERMGIFGLLFDWAASGHNFPLPGGGIHPHQFLDVDDLCQAVFLALTLEPKNANRTCNIGAAEFGTMREDFQAVLDYAGYGRKIVALPPRLSLSLLDAFHKLRLSPVYPWVYELLIKESRVSIEAAQKHWGFAPEFSNRDALLKNFEWFLRQREEPSKGTGVTHRHSWKPGLLSLTKVFF